MALPVRQSDVCNVIGMQCDLYVWCGSRILVRRWTNQRNAIWALGMRGQRIRILAPIMSSFPALLKQWVIEEILAPSLRSPNFKPEKAKLSCRIALCCGNVKACTPNPQSLRALTCIETTSVFRNLNETTKSVYKENVRLTEALSVHMEEENRLKRIKEKLQNENSELKGDNELNEMMIQDKVHQQRNNKLLVKDVSLLSFEDIFISQISFKTSEKELPACQRKRIKIAPLFQMQEKIETLETALSHVVNEFETERKAIVAKAQHENESASHEVQRLHRILEMKNKEVNRIKKLAKNILDQRTEMERFFLEALEQVKMEITANRLVKRKIVGEFSAKAASGHSPNPQPIAAQKN